MQTITVDVVSDVMCPWCYIGKRRLEEALDLLPDIQVDVQWRPFQLDPTLPPQGKDRQTYLNEKFGGEIRAKEIYARVRDAGREEGIEFAFDLIERSPNTLDAHRLLKWARTPGLQNQMAERLFELYFIEGADLTKKQTLLDAARDVGMEVEIVSRLLDGESDLEETKAEIGAAQKMGVTGVPCFIIDSKYAVMGAQNAETIAAAVRQAAGEKADEAQYAEPTGDGS